MAISSPLPGTGELHKALALYAHFLDDHDAENWSKLFAPNGTFNLSSGSFTGREAIKDAIQTMWSRNPERRIVHFCTTSVVRADGDTATAGTRSDNTSPPTRRHGSAAVTAATRIDWCATAPAG